uniref:hypothetical protein n=1 Tax=Amycolatopsis sp. CA-151526 TaxID=3239921 RepID=UPI003F49AA74
MGRAWSIAPDVAEQLGPEQLDRMHGPGWDTALPCSFCGQKVPPDVPTAAIVLEIEGSPVATALWAHEPCHASQVLRMTLDEARARFPALNAAGGSDVEVWPSVMVVDDEGHERALPMLTISYTTEARALGSGPESTNLVMASLLEQGWDLITSLEAGIDGGPRGWSVRCVLRPDGQAEVSLVGPRGPQTVVTVALPGVWVTAADACGQVGVLQGSRLDGAIDSAIRDGRLTGGVVPVVVTKPGQGRLPVTR